MKLDWFNALCELPNWSKKIEKQSIILNQSGEHRDLIPPAPAERVAEEYKIVILKILRTFSGIHGKYILVTKRFPV